MFKVGFLSRGDTTDSLSVEWKIPELRERLTILVIIGIRTEEHSLRRMTHLRLIVVRFPVYTNRIRKKRPKNNKMLP